MIESFVSTFGIAGLLYLLLQLVVTVHILLKKEDVKSAIGWLGLIWLAPLLGNALYILFGINRIHRKARHLRRKTTPLKAWSQQKLRQAEKSFPPYALQFLRLGYQVHPQHFTLGNQVTPFLNGDEAYPAMCRLIQSARKEVLLQSYIFNNDAAGQMFLAALREALANGARVKIMVDGVGLNYAKTPITQALQKLPGAEWAVFLPSRKPADLPFVNLRNHRKML